MNNQFQYPSSAASLFSSAARQTRKQDPPETCVCLERIGDNGPCPRHGDPNVKKEKENADQS